MNTDTPKRVAVRAAGDAQDGEGPKRYTRGLEHNGATMQILAHDENSLTNLLFSEVHRLGKIQELLSAIRWRSGREFPVSVLGVDLHQQLNLSQFGKPDAILLVTDARNRLHLLIIEAKLGLYRDTCARPLAERHFNNALNSKLNNQLTLRYRGMRSLPSLDQSFCLREEPHDAISPYFADIVRQCKKSQTLTFLNNIRTHLDSFWIVALTLDAASPLLTMSPTDPFFPLLFRQDNRTWETDLSNFGALSWAQCNALFVGTENHFSASYEQIIDYPPTPEEAELGEIDEGLAERFLVGRHIVRYHGVPCLFNCRGYSFSLRQWLETRFERVAWGIGDRRKYEDMQPQLEYIQKAPAKDIDDVAFWEGFFRTLTPSSGSSGS